MTPTRRRVDVPCDDALQAVVTDVRELRYTDAPSASLDVVPIVRAASAVRFWRGRWAVVQDDVRALALADDTGRAELVALPAAHDGRRTFDAPRGNKHAKPDFEAAVVLPDGRLVVFGSGASPERERLAIATDVHDVRIHEAHAVYAAVRAVLGDALPNLEGAVVRGDSLCLLQRGTAIGGEARNSIVSLPLGAFLAWLDAGADPPRNVDVVDYGLGVVNGIALGFTDAAALPDGRIAFVACAESTADPTQDGAVVGARFGLLDAAGARQGAIVDRAGAEVRLKIEGLEPVADVPRAFVGVTDADDPQAPALLVRLEIRDQRAVTTPHAMRGPALPAGCDL